MTTWRPELATPRVEPSPRWVRVRAGDVVLADSRRPQLLAWYGPGRLPTYCLPAEDVRSDLLHASGQPARDGFLLDHDVRADGLSLDRVAQLFTDPPPELEAVRDHWTFTWDAGVSWFEEAEEVHVHARDPAKRVDTVPSERHIRVELDGQVVAESRRPHALFETWLPTRWYLPVEDVRTDLLAASDTMSRCPYKGTAAYWSAQVGGTTYSDVAWSYAEPIPECPRIAGLICFFNERVDLTIDGVAQERPRSPWSS
ncbi:MAG TPA: DUF427 domain-containing protein [Acidimicrobiales bacterium]|nr:DUF427 domain-containing protein [Acidimicrobiales bacterium]